MSVVSKPFPLFRLPAIPLKKINRYMDLEDILLISMASKKSAFIMKSLLPPNCFHLEFQFSKKSEISLVAKGLWKPMIVKCEKTGQIYELKIAQDNGVITHWCTSPDLETIVNAMLSHFAIVFNPTISIDFGEICHQEFMMGVLNHVKQLNLVKKLIYLTPVFMSSENYEHILEQCKEVSELWLFCKVASDFVYRAGPDFRMGYLNVEDGHWMHLEDFTNCKRVSVWNSSGHEQPKYTNPEVLRAFIRKWIESECRLQHLETYGGRVRIDFREILSGLEYRTIEQWENTYSVEITRRCDGKKAIVTFGTYNFEFLV
ncbi:hypothetical protein GCK72_003250 [Caenorhabditis remanei]|uniref:F-box domain-containing protein n=1 Tax=Caenorhabditis remanei TaxID=31234 RepID=A0A6A5HX05_CAERE|nr:hypothetical protein GCK72_003250 [Caenorhabditis remanei]KAF1771424.1 hypothetical protein GCK72_003250 [Caenorhabditis remanei]